MSAIDELIAELCPDGVEYHRFSDVCTLKARVGWQRLTKAEQMPTGDYMLVTGTDFTPSNEVDYSTCSYVSKNRYDQDENIQLKNGDVLITKDGTLGKVAVVGNLPKPATLNGGVFVVRSKDGKLYNRYIAHYLQSSYFKRAVDSQKTGSTISHLTQGLFSRLEIPVPPIEVQREIVRILDAFTALTDELTAKLAEEVTARKQQYAHYRGRLLSLESLEAMDGKPVEMVRLGDVCVRQKGMPITAAKMKELASEAGNVVVFGGGKTKVLANRDDLPKGNVIETPSVVVKSRGNIGFEYCDVPFTNKNELWSYAASSSNVDIKFIYHYLDSRRAFFQDAAKVGKLPQISTGITDDFQVSLPSLETQQKVVDILDRFDALTTSLTDGLPAEIEARNQQYEYYRDRLLDFPRKEVAAS
ncbi:restriction endonuclease subunit S [Collinsella sp. HCP28S3_E5]|uniref:restriction endonuclease subunit S n=1 Tax=Collinsella sp. HCP28S3_E5 TaxID=3438922 RepID=UPI003F8CB75C